LDIDGRLAPEEADKQAYPKVKQVYLVRSATLYAQTIRLADHSIKGLSYGRKLTEDEFAALLDAAGGTKEYVGGTPLPDSELELSHVLRVVRDRLGQSDFRASLMEIYGASCAISRCKVVAALEAAHIDPWASSQSQDVSNGLILRADLHTLFDNDLVAINPKTRIVHVAKSIRESEYGQYHGAELNRPSNAAAAPDASALQSRWSSFVTKHGKN